MIPTAGRLTQASDWKLTRNLNDVFSYGRR
jgi:hypothetical protein